MLEDGFDSLAPMIAASMGLRWYLMLAVMQWKFPDLELDMPKLGVGLKTEHPSSGTNSCRRRCQLLEKKKLTHHGDHIITKSSILTFT